MKPYVIVYVDYNSNDLCKESFDTRAEVDAWLEEYEYKAYVLTISGHVEIEDRT